MSRGTVSGRQGRRRHTVHAASQAHELAFLRDALDGMYGSDPEFATTLTEAETAAAGLTGRAARMDRDGQSMRARCEQMVAQAVLASPTNVRT